MGARGWIIFVVIAALALGGLVFMSTQNRVDISEFDAGAIIAPHEKNGNIGDRVYGASDAAVTIIEYGDFQCPSCAGAYVRTKTVVDRYSEHVSFVYRNLPLTQIHPNALAAAAVAEAAGLQDKYWQMHGLLFQNQAQWSSASSNERGSLFEGYARDIALNIDTFKEDVSSAAVDQKIRFDQALYRSTGRDPSTPTFVFEGEVIDSADIADEESLDSFIRARLAEAGVDLEDNED